MSPSKYESCCLPLFLNRLHTSGQCSLSSPRIARALDSLSAPETTRGAFDSARRQLIYAAFRGSHSCFFSLSISRLSLQPLAMSATSIANLGRQALAGLPVKPRPSRQSAAQIRGSKRTPSRGRASRKLATQWQQRIGPLGVGVLTEARDGVSF